MERTRSGWRERGAGGENEERVESTRSGWRARGAG